MNKVNNTFFNLLPHSGQCLVYGEILTPQEGQHYFNEMMDTIEWKNDEAVLFGKHFITARKVAWYAEQQYTYKYSNTVKTALLFSEELRILKQKVEAMTGEMYNSCLLNLYHHGEEGMGWHSDDERALKTGGSIASLSLGAARKFRFKNKRSGETIEVMLTDGFLLEMKGETQKNWLHCLPKMKKERGPRINLTFRQMI